MAPLSFTAAVDPPPSPGDTGARRKERRPWPPTPTARPTAPRASPS